MNPQLQFLLEKIDQGYRKKAWHGPNLRGSLRGVSAVEAAWKPSPRRHSIWEIAIHCAYWKYAVGRRISGDKRGSFPRQGSNWFSPIDLSDGAWKKDLALLETMHARMKQAIARLKDSDLNRRAANSGQKNADLIWGIAAHDIYHAGQIQLLKKLRGE